MQPYYKINMNKKINLLLLGIVLVSNIKAQKVFKINENGIGYTIISNAKSKTKPVVKKGETIAYSLKQVMGDSVAFNSYLAGHQTTVVDGIKQYLDFRYLFAKVRVGDSLIVGMSVDTIYKKQVELSKKNDPEFNEESFRKNVPQYFLQTGNIVVFQFKIFDKFTNLKKSPAYAADAKRLKTFLKIQSAKQLAYEEKMQALELEKMNAIAAPNKEKGKNFLAENKKTPGVIETKSGLQYFIIKEGTGNTATLSNTVVCNYLGTTIDGKEFDNSYTRGEPLEFSLNGVIAGWTEVLQKMNAGSKFKVWLPSSLAYGDTGAGDAIGPGETLIFEIELLNIK